MKWRTALADPRGGSVLPSIDPDRIGWISRDEMIEVDRIMIEDLRIELIQMMENAGRNLARLVLDLAIPRRVTVVAGSGGNGGGGLVAARHLHNAGVDVAVLTTRPGPELGPVPSHQANILDRMGVPIVDRLPTAPSESSDVILDAVIGYSLRGAPHGRSAELIEEINRSPATVFSLDNPSGLDVDTGTTPGVAVAADATMTLALPKKGLRQSALVGALYLADISVPPEVTAGLGPAAPDFLASSIVAL